MYSEYQQHIYIKYAFMVFDGAVGGQQLCVFAAKRTKMDAVENGFHT